MNILSNNSFYNYKKRKSNEFKEKFKNKYSLPEINKIFNSLGENIETWEIDSSKTKNPNESKKIVFLKYVLLSDKKHNDKAVNNFFINIFSKEQPLIIICIFSKKVSISFKANCLNNKLVKEIIKKHSYKTNFFDEKELEYFFDLGKVNNNSILDMFDEICRRIVYYEQFGNNFSYSITWEIIAIFKEIKNYENHIKKLEKDIKTTYNISKRIEINKEIQTIKNKIEEKNKIISKYCS